jgi:hypothetical protein
LTLKIKSHEVTWQLRSDQSCCRRLPTMRIVIYLSILALCFASSPLQNSRSLAILLDALTNLKITPTSYDSLERSSDHGRYAWLMKDKIPSMHALVSTKHEKRSKLEAKSPDGHPELQQEEQESRSVQQQPGQEEPLHALHHVTPWRRRRTPNTYPRSSTVLQVLFAFVCDLTNT